MRPARRDAADRARRAGSTAAPPKPEFKLLWGVFGASITCFFGCSARFGGSILDCAYDLNINFKKLFCLLFEHHFKKQAIYIIIYEDRHKYSPWWRGLMALIFNSPWWRGLVARRCQADPPRGMPGIPLTVHSVQRVECALHRVHRFSRRAVPLFGV